MSKHTPGPWMISRGAQNDPFAIEGPDVTVAHIKMVSTRGRKPEVEANAHLIAAAPDLLMMCEILAEYKNIGQKVKAHLHAAIAKAKGETVPS